MSRGRPANPKPLKIVASQGDPDMPDFLCEIGQKEWKRITIELRNLKLLAKVDRACLVAYCEAWAEFVFLVKEVEVHGYIDETTNGNTIQHPLVGAKNKAAERLLKYACQFGMTPAARSRIDIEEKGKPGGFGNFSRGAAG